MLINEYLPSYQFSEKHTIKINAPGTQVLSAIIDLPPNEISVPYRVLLYVRSIPSKILGRPYIGFFPDIPLIKQLEDKGFNLLEKNKLELVLGVIGQFGRLKGGRINQMNDFINFKEKESGKVATNFFLEENDDQDKVQ